MDFTKYILNFIVLPYYTFAKHFLRRKSFGYNLFVILNLIWMVFLFGIFAIGIWSCFQ